MLLRRSGSLLLRLGSGAAAAAGGGGGWAPQSAAALQLLHIWQHGSGSEGQGAGWQHHQHMSARHLSLWPGGGGNKPEQQQQQPLDSVAAGGEGFGTSSSAPAGQDALGASGGVDFAAAAAGPSGAAASDLFSVSAIIAAAAGAEADALEAAREDSWAGTRAVQSVLTGLHGALGLEWWQSIMVATCAMRLATLPLMVSQVKNTYRMSQARPEIESLVEHMKEEQARGNTDAAMQHQQRVMEVWKKYKCNPFKSLMGLFVQAPIFIGFFSALRGFAAHKVPSLTEGGALWFTDLTVADPTYALPALAGLTFLVTIELGAADGMEGQPEAMRKKMKALMRVVALMVPAFSYSLPASVFMYWTASNLFSLLQTSLLKMPAVKRVLGLPDLKKMRQAPQAATAQAGQPAQLLTYATRPRKQQPKAAKEA